MVYSCVQLCVRVVNLSFHVVLSQAILIIVLTQSSGKYRRHSRTLFIARSLVALPGASGTSEALSKIGISLEERIESNGDPLFTLGRLSTLGRQSGAQILQHSSLVTQLATFQAKHVFIRAFGSVI
jgi:hypothetical protein